MMYHDTFLEILLSLLLALLLVFLMIFPIVLLYNEEKNKEKEIIEHSENFNVYEECFNLNDKYYCRIEK